MDKPSFIPRPQKQHPSSLIVVLFILISLLTVTTVIRVQMNKMSLSSTQEKLLETEQKIQSLEAENAKEYVYATKFLAQQGKKTLPWSEMFKKFQDLTPVSVFYSSFSLAETGQWNVSGVADSYDAVADVVRAFEKSKDFQAEFVPSVTTGASADGQPVMSFSLRVSALTPEQ